MKNPGGSMVCTVIGSLFYAATLLFGLYTMGFTFVLWRQFFVPLQSLWSRLKTYKICCPCAIFMDYIISPITRPCFLYFETNQMLNRMNSHSSQMKNTMDSRLRKKRRPVTCGDIFCSSTSFAHYLLWMIAVIMTGMALYDDVVDGFSPLGICTVAGQEEGSIIKYNVIPFTAVFIAATFFVPFAIYLLCKVADISSNKEQKRLLRNLGARILWYFIFQEICWIGICEVSWVVCCIYDIFLCVLKVFE